jgi:ATP-dependent DNA helicase RecG
MNIGRADQLGSGIRNLYKYTKLYSGGEPELIEGDIFKTIIPLVRTNDKQVISASDKAQIKRNLKRNDNNGALIEDAIIEYLIFYPQATQVEIAEELGKSRRSVQGAFAKLQKSGKLNREGSKKNGTWIVTKQGMNPESN